SAATAPAPGHRRDTPSSAPARRRWPAAQPPTNAAAAPAPRPPAGGCTPDAAATPPGRGRPASARPTPTGRGGAAGPARAPPPPPPARDERGVGEAHRVEVVDPPANPPAGDAAEDAAGVQSQGGVARVLAQDGRQERRGRDPGGDVDRHDEQAEEQRGLDPAE